MRLRDSIKQVLKIWGTTYRDLAERMQMSEASIKRLFSKHAVSLTRLEEICEILDLDFTDRNFLFYRKGTAKNDKIINDVDMET